MNLERQLSELFVLRNNALADASVASKWVLCIHDAFYMTKATVRRTSKFLEMETKLVQTFEELSAGDESDFWVFAVLVVLQLAQETPQRNTSDRKKDMVQLVGTETEKPMDKKTKKRSQPYAPLAFMVINALRKLTEGEGKRQQLRHCHIQGNENQALRDFCVHGLQDSTFVRMQMSNWDVRPLTEPQLTYAALDAYCLVQITNKLRKNEDTKLPPWEATAAEIHELAYPSPLTNEETVEAISLRNKYHKDWVKKEPCVACIEANCKLDTAQLAMLCGVSRRRIKLATPAECCDYFGFEPGTIPPFGHREQSDHRVRIYASSTLQHVKSLVCGGGSHESLLWLNSKAYFALIDIETVGDIQRGVSAVESINEQATKPPARQERKVSIREYKFLADSMVARVGKWLRTIGMDVIIWDPYSVPKKTASQDHKAALLALSVCEQRILLTRDKKLANRRDAGACFVVSSDDPFKQFQEIKTHFALKLVKDEMMSRCSRCNAKGFDVVDLDYVRNQTEDEVHPNVLEVVTEFWVCRVCHKIYWEGPNTTPTTPIYCGCLTRTVSSTRCPRQTP
ncbi:ABC transporter C family member 9 [Phytophthora nicotianae]|uniref:ABC transporter C family member 9 n=1 Tax=Phytophthora nicotianae TaxID=4792 RepID=A0A0W8D8H9_PHYNI|nr:ABC transporter C family member 9 [Phytophthora nicotianae]